MSYVKVFCHEKDCKWRKIFPRESPLWQCGKDEIEICLEPEPWKRKPFCLSYEVKENENEALSTDKRSVR